jgi:hypothetical protein
MTDNQYLYEAQRSGATTADSWEQYVQEKADEFEVDFDTAWALFQTLGPSEAFDGFVTMLEDYSEE